MIFLRVMLCFTGWLTIVQADLYRALVRRDALDIRDVTVEVTEHEMTNQRTISEIAVNGPSFGRLLNSNQNSNQTLVSASNNGRQDSENHRVKRQNIINIQNCFAAGCIQNNGVGERPSEGFGDSQNTQQWGAWGAWSRCDRSCGVGNKSCVRYCTGS